jgi:hypothetical protein
MIRMGLTETPEDKEAMYEEVARLDNKGGGQDVKDLFLKHRDVIDFFLPLFHIPAFHNTLSPNKLVKAKQVVWGVSLLSFQYALHILTFLDCIALLEVPVAHPQSPGIRRALTV